MQCNVEIYIGPIFIWKWKLYTNNTMIPRHRRLKHPITQYWNKQLLFFTRFLACSPLRPSFRGLVEGAAKIQIEGYNFITTYPYAPKRSTILDGD